MSYEFRAVLSNPQRPDYGQLTVPFPIPNEDYERILDMLGALDAGDVLAKDCHIDEIDSHYSVLKRLEGQAVNVDELDYLAKRLDSFCVGEDAQFQSMAEKLDLTDIRDFINLTFCCRQATVINNFSNLEQIGKDHYMNLNGGCVKNDELENLDGEETARLLIDSGAGVVTPYGVVYDNGMKLEPLYDGRHFPAYLYDPPVLALEAAAEGGNITGLLCLPMSECQLERSIQRAELERPDIHLKVSIDALPEEVSDALELEGLTAGDIYGLNRLCKAVEFFNDYGMEKLSAAVLLTGTSGTASLCLLAESIDMFDFIPNVRTPEEYGRYMIQQSGHFEYDENLEDFYDYAKYGEQHIRQNGGQFNERGYIAFNGEMALEEFMLGSPDEGQHGVRMGEMQ